VSWPEPFGTDGKPECVAFAEAFFPQIHELFTQGWFKCHPLKEEAGGFEGLLEGVKLLRQGKIKGQKLIYQTADRKPAVESVPKAGAAMDATPLSPVASVAA
jgi:hypothetical protein